MKRKRLGVLLAVAGLCLICACGGGNSGAGGASQDMETSISQQTGDAQTDSSESGERSGEEEGSQGTEQGDQQTTETESKETVPAEKISNNGGYFVGVEDKVYYREYGPYSLNGIALYGEFLGGESYGGSTIKCLEPGKAEPSVIAESDDGYGKLYYHRGFLYSQRLENYENSVIYRINLENGDWENLCTGTLLGGSEDGRYLAISEYVDGRNFLKILDGGIACKNEYSALSGYFNYVGSHEDKVFFLLFSDTEEDVYLMQYDYDGNLVNLAKMPKDETGYATYLEARNLFVENGKLHFTWEFYEGTGHFLNAVFEVSVPIRDDAKGVNSAIPLYEPEVRAVECWEDSQHGIYSQDYKALQTEDPDVTRLKDELAVWPKGISGVAVIPQTVEKVNGDVYCVLARAHRNSFDDIGWRESYQEMDLEYLIYPGGAAGAKELARVCASEGPVTAYLWAIGTPGAETGKVVYRPAIFMGPEVMPELDEMAFGASFAEDVLYEYPNEDDIYGEWNKGTLKEFYEMLRKNKKSYMKQEPKESGYQGYELPSSVGTNGVIAVHIGFDDDGRINYVRPVMMD